MPHQPGVEPSQETDGFLSKEKEPNHALYDWRSNVLDTFLPLASLAIFPSVVQTVLQVIKNSQIAW